MQRAIMGAIAALAVAGRASAQHAPHSAPIASDSISRFLAEARDAGARYADRRVAIADGYRRIGPDFPGMGEHWVQPGLLVSGRFDVAQPPVLTYIVVAGRPVLTGLAYALPLLPDESPPAFPAPGAWHDHTRTLDEESLLLHSTRSSAGTAAARLSMLHVWLWVENPAGIFAQDNWALPFARQGVPRPARATPQVARALSLASGGARYYRALIAAMAGPSAAEKTAIDSALDDGARAVEASAERARRAGAMNDAALTELGAIWASLWDRFAAELSPGTVARLEPLRRGG